jgi:hypothetical protein
MRNKWSSRRPFVSNRTLRIHHCPHFRNIGAFFNFVPNGLHQRELPRTENHKMKKKFAYTMDIFVKTTALYMNVFYVGVQVEFKMSSKHILQNNFQNFEVKTNDIIN